MELRLNSIKQLELKIKLEKDLKTGVCKDLTPKYELILVYALRNIRKSASQKQIFSATVFL